MDVDKKATLDGKSSVVGVGNDEDEKKQESLLLLGVPRPVKLSRSREGAESDDKDGKCPSSPLSVVRPRSLKHVDWSPELSAKLEALACKPADLPHLLFSGPSGAGKRTRVHLFLKRLFGPQPVTSTVEEVAIGDGERTRRLPVTIYHTEAWVEVHPALYGTDDRHVIRHILSDYAATSTFHRSVTKTTATPSSVSPMSASVPFKIVVLYNLDAMSVSAQCSLRATLQTYSQHTRLIFTAESTSHIIEPLESRYLHFRLARPTLDQLRTLLVKSGFSERIDDIFAHSGRNTHRAFWTTEYLHSTLAETTTITTYNLEWENLTLEIATSLISPIRFPSYVSLFPFLILYGSLFFSP